MNSQRSPIQVVWKSFTIILLVLLAFQSFGINGLAAPATPSLNFQQGDNHQLACTPPSTTPTKFCDIQIVLLIDDSGSMRTNDPQKDPAGGLRNQGAKNLVDVLARQYYLPAVQLKADNPKVQLPDVRVAVIHFSANVKEYSGWININPSSLDDWKKQQGELYKLIDWKNNYATMQYTHFIQPFQRVAELFKSSEVQTQGGNCTRRSILLFTDGTPEDVGGILTGDDLKQEMDTVEATVKSFQDALPDDSKAKIYITGFKIDPNYWNLEYDEGVQLDAKWTAIANYAQTSPENGTLKQVQLVDSLDKLPPRMEAITASLAGVQSLLVNLEDQASQSYSVEIPKHIQSLRLTLYNLDSTAGLQITDPNRTVLKADGEKVILSGEETSIEVWELDKPLAGKYNIQASKPGGIITALVTYQSLSVKPSIEPNQLQVGQPSNIQFTLVDDSGDVVLLDEENLSVSQDGQILPLEQTGDVFQFSWTPKSEGKSQFEVEAHLVDVSGNYLLDCSGNMEVNVDSLPPPPTLHVTPPTSCVSPDAAITLPVQLYYEGDRAWADTLEWNVSADGQDINGTVTAINKSMGEYELRIDPIKDTGVEEIQLTVSAEAVIDGQTVKISDSTTTLIQICPPCDCFPIWLIFVWLMMWLMLLLLGWIILRDVEININFWLLIILEIVLAVVWFILFSEYMIYLFWMLLLIVLLIILVFIFRKVIRDISWWLIILLTLFVSIWFVLFGSFPFWLILLLLLMWLAFLILIWIFKMSEPPSWRWLLLVLLLILALVSIIYFSPYWIFLLLWLLTILVLTLVILVIGPICPPIPPPPPGDDLKDLEGIEGDVEQLLNDHGIYTFRQLAEADISQLNKWLNENDWKYMDPKTWPQQAQLADIAKRYGKKSDEQSYKAYKKWLKNGIEPDEYEDKEKVRRPEALVWRGTAELTEKDNPEIFNIK